MAIKKWPEQKHKNDVIKNKSNIHMEVFTLLNSISFFFKKKTSSVIYKKFLFVGCFLLHCDSSFSFRRFVKVSFRVKVFPMPSL